MSAVRTAVAALVLVTLWAAPRAAQAERAPRAHAQVIVDIAPLMSGPGQGYRRVGVAHRGEIYPIIARARTGHWLRIVQPDGTRVWIIGAAVQPLETDRGSEEAPFAPRLFAPSPLPEANAEIALQVGELLGGGFFAARPSWLIRPEFSLELTGAISASSAGRLFAFGLGAIVNLAPESPVHPFLVGGGGGAYGAPNADAFLLESGLTAMVYGGGGLRMVFRGRVIARIEARSYVFFEPDRFRSDEEISGGLSVFF